MKKFINLYIFFIFNYFKNISFKIATLMKSILFSDVTANVLQKDHMKPIFISKGLDSLESIGIPSVKIYFNKNSFFK